jgi:hypothetical protein
MKKCIFFYLTVLFLLPGAAGQQPDASDLAAKIKAYKQDIRGPYKDLRWFCSDGSIRAPKDPCPEEIGPGLQHARHKDEVARLAEQYHLFLGQILAASEKEAFWDANRYHSRIKQYQLGNYLEGVDDGWILRKAQYYRGAVQSEDETAWGRAFYQWLLAQPDVLETDFFLIRQSMKDVPHSGDNNLSQRMRSQSKTISDAYLPFMDLRIKIHGQPEAADIARVRSFGREHRAAMSPEIQEELEKLLGTMVEFYRPIDLKNWLEGMEFIKDGPMTGEIVSTARAIALAEKPSERIRLAAELLFNIRTGIMLESRPEARLQLLDLTLQLEEILFKDAPLWEPANLAEGLDKICHLGMASAGAGYLEIWEWQELLGSLGKSGSTELSLNELNHIGEAARSAVEWSAALVKANYQETVSAYSAFEPLAYGFIDDQVRGSIALHLGRSVAALGNFISSESKLTNRVMDIPNQSSIRGLNPGYALGELVVIGGNSEDIEVSSEKIYLFQRSPSDLKPVAGIGTVAEGNLVSHVQLLARNLGIPNAALSDENLQNLQKYAGQLVFYAVSNKGNVLLKPADQMTTEEKALFAKKERSEDRIAVPVEKIQLARKGILNLREVDASDSGILCGPKAANLGQLKKLFPALVVEGLVIPFGIFRDHMNLPMPGHQGTYWEFLKAIFTSAETMRSQGIAEPEVENFQLRQLEILRESIKKMELQPTFVRELENKFDDIFGKPLGELPVFLRSDTNMEDLKDFTGAGLNLTLFNVVDRQKILNGIKEVWASPYTERSFKWRQRYLLNPENVFPSILVIPSVDVDCSGVLITKGINAGDNDDLTLAFSRGAGGAVDGQAAETYLINSEGGYRLLAPAREPFLNRLPETGGTERKATAFNERVLSPANLEQIRELAGKIRSLIPKETASDYQGAYDVEFGLKDDNLWLFQIRPFVENKKALSSAYLESITPEIDGGRKISLSRPLP